MDVLSDILKVLKLKSSIYFRTQLRAPWGIAVPEQQDVARFHVLIRGRCWIGVPDGGEPQELNEGDLFIIPHGSAHTLRCENTTPAIALSEVLESSGFDGETLVYGGRGRETNLVCGHFEFDHDVIHPLLASLPSRIHLRANEKTGFAWLDDAMAFILEEASSDQPGASAVIDRLSEILFIQVLRAFVAQDQQHSGCLSGLAERHVGAALRLLHRNPAHSWTVEELADRVALSRAAFTTKFSRLIGLSPGQYLTRWRMQLARMELLETTRDIASIGESVGYQSEAAFHKAFKRHFGQGPAAYRKAGKVE